MARVHVVSAPHAGAVEHHGHFEKVYYLDPNGLRWRVYDRVRTETGFRAECPPTSAAVARIFVAESGARLIYRFTRAESKETIPTLLLAQLKAGRVQPLIARRLAGPHIRDVL